MAKADRVYLAHILECIAQIQEYTAQGRQIEQIYRNLTLTPEA
ncbi:MAG: hypothetical protein ACO331_07875 [Prochlorothrix sp.]